MTIQKTKSAQSIGLGSKSKHQNGSRPALIGEFRLERLILRRSKTTHRGDDFLVCDAHFPGGGRRTALIFGASTIQKFEGALDCGAVKVRAAVQHFDRGLTLKLIELGSESGGSPDAV